MKFTTVHLEEMNLHPSRTIWGLFFLCLFSLMGCNRNIEAAENNPAATTEKTADAGNARASVARIVFLDQEQCCDCTRRRIENSWTELQTALPAKNNIQVDRVHVDTQESLAEPYRKLRPNQVIPAIYFLDEKGALIEMLQGEVTVAAIQEVLK
jgi:hypothetical protein